MGDLGIMNRSFFAGHWNSSENRVCLNGRRGEVMFRKCGSVEALWSATSVMFCHVLGCRIIFSVVSLRVNDLTWLDGILLFILL